MEDWREISASKEPTLVSCGDFDVNNVVMTHCQHAGLHVNEANSSAGESNQTPNNPGV